jgi:hypothetical protein
MGGCYLWNVESKRMGINLASTIIVHDCRVTHSPKYAPPAPPVQAGLFYVLKINRPNNLGSIDVTLDQPYRYPSGGPMAVQGVLRRLPVATITYNKPVLKA